MSRTLRINTGGLGFGAASFVQDPALDRETRGNEPASGHHLKPPPRRFTDAEAHARTLRFIAGEEEAP